MKQRQAEQIQEQSQLSLPCSNHLRRDTSQWKKLVDVFFIIPLLLLRVLCGFSAHQRRISFEGSAAALVHGNPVLELVQCSLLRLVLQDATREVIDVYSEKRMNVYVDDTNETFKLSGRKKQRKQQGKYTIDSRDN